MFFQSEPNTKDKGNKYIKKKVRYRKIIENRGQKSRFLIFWFFQSHEQYRGQDSNFLYSSFFTHAQHVA